MNRPLHFIRSTFLILTAYVLSACAAFDQVGVKGASSMTIDVEVYKGPLSKTLDIQVVELQSITRDAETWLFDIKDQIGVVHKTYNARNADNGIECRRLKNIKGEYYDYDASSSMPSSGREDLEPSLECYLFQSMFYDADFLETILNNAGLEFWQSEFREAIAPTYETYSECPSDEPCPTPTCTQKKPCVDRERLASVARIGAYFRTRADHWATTAATSDVRDENIKRFYANFAHFASEYGNQIVSRVDSILLQMDMDGQFDRQSHPLTGTQIAGLVSTGRFLRDSGTTNYLHLYDWIEGSPPQPADSRRNIGPRPRPFLGRNVDGSNGPLDLERSDRVRMVQMLINDTYWSNINSVYASGQGDVSMAFIKDDIGNWNLKSFKNDPAELLNAYDDLARASVQGAITAIRSGAENASGANALLSVAQSAVTGKPDTSQTLDSSDLTKMRENFLSQVASSKSSLTTSLETLTKESEEAEKAVQNNAYAKSLLTTEKEKELSGVDGEIVSLVKSARKKAHCEPAPADTEELAAGENENTPQPDTAVCSALDPDGMEPSLACEKSADLENQAELLAACDRRKAIDVALKQIKNAELSAKATCASNYDKRTSLATECETYTKAVAAHESARKKGHENLKRLISDYQAVLNALQLASADGS